MNDFQEGTVCELCLKSHRLTRNVAGQTQGKKSNSLYTCLQQMSTFTGNKVKMVINIFTEPLANCKSLLLIGNWPFCRSVIKGKIP